MRQNLIFTRWVSHTYQVEGALANFLIFDERMETARRGYLLSHDETFATAVDATAGELDRTLTSIQQLTADAPEQQANVARLKSLLAQQRQAISVSMAFARGGHNDTSDFYRAIRNLLHDQISLQQKDSQQRDAEHFRAKRSLARNWRELLAREVQYRSAGGDALAAP